MGWPKFTTSFYGLTFVALGLFCDARGATFYVSPDGDNLNSGLSPKEAWRSIAKVNSVTFSPGDRVLLEGGKTFRGPLKFDGEDGGDGKNPLMLGSFRMKESGRAVIHAGDGRGIEVYNTSGLRIADLVIKGDGAEQNVRSGISLLTSNEDGAGDIWIDSAEISGFGKCGISIGAWETKAGYKNVRITHASMHDNLLAGVFSWGPWGGRIYAHRDIYVGDSYAFNMKGGSGLILSSVDGGVIERCVVHSNGSKVSGAAGIWAWDANNIVFQYNESYGNRTTGVDGDGFDFDGGVTNSVMQYNYSHDNDAAGFLLAQYAFAPQAMQNIVIRYNISENDCRKNEYGAIHVWKGDDGDRISDVQIYQNTVYLAAKRHERAADATETKLPGAPEGDETPEYRPKAIAVISPTTSVSIQNNLFYTTGGGTLVSVVAGQKTIRFRNNAYWSANDPFQVEWMGMNYSSLGEWLKAAGDQERLGSRVLAVYADPMLEAPGTGGTLGQANLLTTLTGYKLRPGSPLAGRGMNLAHDSGIDPGNRGFFGMPISQATPPAIGAHVAVGPL